MAKAKINVQDKQIAQTLNKIEWIAGASGTGRLHDLNARKDLREGNVGTIELGDRVYDCYLYQTPGSMIMVYGHSKWSVQLYGRENEADRLEKIETGKWLLSKGV